MRIEGKEIAQEILENLRHEVARLQKNNIIPHVAIILVGDDPASAAYVHRKELKTQEIGGEVSIFRLPLTTLEYNLLELIDDLNRNPDIHGIIVQRPLPEKISSKKVNEATAPKKDIDGFRKDSPYQMPLPAAVIKILENIYSSRERSESRSKSSRQSSNNNNFLFWLKSKNIVVIGKGETGGGPVINLLRKFEIQPIIVDSKTQNPLPITKKADIIISTVGRPQILTSSNIKRGVILIGVGMYRGDDGKLHTDYEEDEIKDIASFYTPVPGGVGPVNVAALLSNLIAAAGGTRTD